MATTSLQVGVQVFRSVSQTGSSLSSSPAFASWVLVLLLAKQRLMLAFMLLQAHADPARPACWCLSLLPVMLPVMLLLLH